MFCSPVQKNINNPLYILSNKGLQILAPNKQPIGSFEFRKPFTQEHITLNSGDCLYLFSDGYADQFGGPNGKKYMYKRLRGLLENVGSFNWFKPSLSNTSCLSWSRRRF